MQDARMQPIRWLVASLIGLLAMSLTVASAAHNLRVAVVDDLAFEEENDDGEDETVETMGLRFEIDDGLRIVVTNEDAGRVGDVYVPAFAEAALPTNALDDYRLRAAIRDVGVVEAYPGGFTFVLEETDNREAMETFMAHLRSIGAQVGPMEASGHAFGFTADGFAYRAVFGADPNGTLVYLGH